LGESPFKRKKPDEQETVLDLLNGTQLQPRKTKEAKETELTPSIQQKSKSKAKQNRNNDKNNSTTTSDSSSVQIPNPSPTIKPKNKSPTNSNKAMTPQEYVDEAKRALDISQEVRMQIQS